MSGLCNNANQVAHRANSTGVAGQESVDKMIQISQEIWKEVKKSMVKKYQETANFVSGVLDVTELQNISPFMSKPQKFSIQRALVLSDADSIRISIMMTFADRPLSSAPNSGTWDLT